MSNLDRAVTEAGGIALRYGNFYGDRDDGVIAAVRQRKFPIVGDGADVWSRREPPRPLARRSTPP